MIIEPGDLTAIRAITARMSPYADTMAGYRCAFLDIVSAGKGGLDFRIDPARVDIVPGRAFMVRAKVFGATDTVSLRIGEDDDVPMTRGAGTSSLWNAPVDGVVDGLHRLTVRSGAGEGRIEILVRNGDLRPKRNPKVAPGRNVNAIGAWPERGIDGAQRGPNKSGLDW